MSTKNARRKLKAEAAAAKNPVPLQPEPVIEAGEAHEGVKRKLSANSEEQCSAVSARKARRKLSIGKVSKAKEFCPTEFQKDNEIVTDSSCPPPFHTFDDAAAFLGPSLLKAMLEQRFTAPTPIQSQAWPSIARGMDAIGVAKTGSGKTLAFLMPAFVNVIRNGPAAKPKWIDEYTSERAFPSSLVVAPTRELVQQIALEAEKFAPVAGARIVAIFGGVPKGDQVRQLRQGVDTLIATPGRLLDLTKGNEKLNRYPPVALTSVRYVVLDEADKMLDMGFAADVHKIVGQCRNVGSRQTLFFTATWPKMVQAAAASLTKADAVHIRIGQVGEKLTANKSVTQVVHVIDEAEKFQTLQKVLKTELKTGGTAMVFVATKAGCDLLEEKLKSVLGDKVWCACIHKGKEQSVRDARLKAFRNLTMGSTGWSGVLIATDVASRGLDIPGVAFVVAYDFSHEKSGAFAVKNHVHRIGRTGRAGKTGRAFVFITPKEDGAKELVTLLEGAGQDVPAALRTLATKINPKRENEYVKRTSRQKKKLGI